MHYYAQTNIQLFNQLQLEGYSADDLSRIHAGYALATQLFSGLYRPSGKTFIAHVVGTASILAACGAPVWTVAAGLLHAAYEHGDFGDRPSGITQTRRTQVRNAVGEAAEARIARYAILHWRPHQILERLATLDSLDRDALFIRLANELEDHLDCGVLYCPNAESRRKRSEARSAIVVDLAAQLGYPSLATELEKVYRDTGVTEISAQLRNHGDRTRAYLVLPTSYRKKFSVLLNRKIRKVFARMGAPRIPGFKRLRRR